MTTFTTITIHELDQLATPVSGDEFPIWDISEEEYLRITYDELTAALTTSIAADGLDGTGGVLAVDVTDFIDTAYGLTESSNDIRINLAATSGLEFSSGALQLKDDVAGAGLTISSKVLAVGAGTLITVGADTVGLTAAGDTYQIVASGASTTPTWTNISTLAGAGMTATNGVLNVIAGDGIDVAADSVAVDVTDLIGIGLSEDGDNNLVLGTPTTLTASTTNAVTTTSHTHAITSTADGAANHSTLLASSAAGGLTLDSLSTSVVTIPQTTVDVAQSLLIVEPANPTSTNFGMTIENATFNGVRDTVYTLGFNRLPDRDLALACMHLQWEDNYRHSPSLSRSEFFLQTYAPSGVGGTISRPWQVNLEHQADTINQFWNADGYTWYFRNAYDDIDVYYVSMTGERIAIGGSNYLRFDVNNSAIVKQKNAAGTYFSLLTLDSSDRIVIGDTAGTATTVNVPTASQFDGTVTLLPGGLGSLNTAIKFGWTADARFQHHISSWNTNVSEIANRLGFLISDKTNSGRNEVLSLTGAKRVGVNDTAPDGTLHVQTANAAAVPVLLLEQLDVSEEMIEFTSVAGTGNAIEAVGGKSLTTTHFIKVTINGDTRYIPAGTIA